MAERWTSHRIGDGFEDAVCFPRGCREQYLVHPEHSHSSLGDKGVFLSGISHFVKPYAVQRVNPGYHVLLLSVGGAGGLKTGQKHRSLKQGDLLVAPMKSSYRYEANGEWSCVWFHLAADTAWSSVLPDDIVVVAARHADFISSLSEQYLTERKNRLVDSNSAEQALANLIVLFIDRELRQLPLRRKDQEIRRRIEQVWQDVVTNLAYPWTTEGLARDASMSASQFNRYVKLFHKATPMTVVLNYRMQRAREMLSFTDHRLEAIAANVGYETAFAFSRAFKRHVGKSPSDFRKGIRES